MTIRRQYSLPNCTLVLDGLSDGVTGITTGTPDSRPLMSNLFNAECHFVGVREHLHGGRDFLIGLVSAVSDYAQEFLSGISHPHKTVAGNELVSIAKGDRENIHQLKVKQEDNSSAGSGNRTTELNLSTIQLFDLLEAIDQFLADKRTLPDIMVPFQPIAKALTKPIAKQAVPAGLGVSALVAASLIGSALPSPKVTPPSASSPTPAVKPTTAPAASPAAATTAPTSAQPAATASPQPLASATAPAKIEMGTIVEATQVGFLQRKLQRDLNLNWQQRSRIARPASFAVNVNQDGQIVSYKVVNKTDAAAAKLTPLPKLSNNNNDPNQAVGNFNVTFEPSGAIDVAPSQKLQGEAGLGKAISDRQLQQQLAAKLQANLQKSLGNKPAHSRNLRYRVGVTQSGAIVDYEPLNATAWSHENRTPLPKLTQFNPQAAISQEPLAQYNVIFRADGNIIVRPQQ